MALDIHKSINGQAKELLFSIDDASYSILVPAFENYENKTGQYIDPYGSYKLTSGHEILITSLNESLSKNNEHNKLFEKVINILKEAHSNNYGVVFLGD